MNVQRLRGGLVFKAHRLVYHPTLGLRLIKKRKKKRKIILAQTRKVRDQACPDITPRLRVQSGETS